MIHPFDKEILRLAIPSILANLTVPLVGLVDLAVAGHLDGSALFEAAALIGGISIGSMLFDLLYWNFAFLRVCTGGLTAQAWGRSDKRECARLFFRAFLLALACSVFILLIQWPFSFVAGTVLDCSDEVKELALKYFHIRIWAAPATLGLMVCRGWFIGMQDSFSSMATDLIVNSVNIVTSIILALGIGTWDGIGYSGIATGTVIAQYSGLGWALLRVRNRLSMLKWASKDRLSMAEVFDRKDLRDFTRMNSDVLVRSLCFTVIYIGFTVISAKYGDLMLASCTILMKLMMIFSFFTDGFAYAGEALTGRFIGHGSQLMVRKTITHVFAWSLSIVAFFMVGYAFAGMPLLNLMTSDRAVVEACSQFLPWLILMPPLGCVAFTWDGIFLGATATTGVRNAMLWAAVAFFFCWWSGKLILQSCCNLPHGSASFQALSIHVLMIAYFAHLLARALVLSFTYRSRILKRYWSLN